MEDEGNGHDEEVAKPASASPEVCETVHVCAFSKARVDAAKGDKLSQPLFTSCEFVIIPICNKQMRVLVWYCWDRLYRSDDAVEFLLLPGELPKLTLVVQLQRNVVIELSDSLVPRLSEQVCEDRIVEADSPGGQSI